MKGHGDWHGARALEPPAEYPTEGTAADLANIQAATF